MAVALLLAFLGALAVASPIAAASELPECKGLDFKAILGPDESGECTWRIQLHEGQEASLEGDQVSIYYEEEGRRRISWYVVAPPASDAVGAAVPTTIALSEGDLITLAVHHRLSDPAAVGAPFTYPIVEGRGWTGGFQTYEVQMPPQEQPQVAPPPAPPPACHVPALRHDSLDQARAQLRAGGCTLAGVHRHPGVSARRGRVVKQSAAPGTDGPLGFAVTVTLGHRPSASG